MKKDKDRSLDTIQPNMSRLTWGRLLKRIRLVSLLCRLSKDKKTGNPLIQETAMVVFLDGFVWGVVFSGIISYSFR
jgi:hypothetical protein